MMKYTPYDIHTGKCNQNSILEGWRSLKEKHGNHKETACSKQNDIVCFILPILFLYVFEKMVHSFIVMPLSTEPWAIKYIPMSINRIKSKWAMFLPVALKSFILREK